jgi:hypothetical protein
MKTFTTIILMCCITAGMARTQLYSVDETSKAEISKLEFMCGNWEGSGWMMGRDGQRHEFRQTEDLRFKLEGTALLIEGHGESNGETVHKALAIVRWNKEKEEYTFSSFLPDGRGGDFRAELKDGKFYWYPNEFITYIISLNEKGQWYETGEMKRGEQSYQFFEMTLDRID